MEQYFAMMFEDIRLERSLILLLALIDPDILRQSEFTQYGITILKKINFRGTTAATHFGRTHSHVFTRITIRIVYSVE